MTMLFEVMDCRQADPVGWSCVTMNRYTDRGHNASPCLAAFFIGYPHCGFWLHLVLQDIPTKFEI